MQSWPTTSKYRTRLIDFLKQRGDTLLLQEEYRLVAFIEEEVQDAHIRLETVLLLIDLVIALGSEFSIRERLLGTNRIAEINYTLNIFTLNFEI